MAAGKPVPNVGWLRGLRGLRWAMLGLLVLGVAATIAGYLLADHRRTEHLGNLGEAVGTAVIVATLLAQLIDVRVQDGFRRELAQSVFLAVLRQDAPEAYQDEVISYLRQIRKVCTLTTISLQLDWISGSDEVLDVRAELLHRGRCISSEGSQFKEYWAIASTRGHESRYESINIEINDEPCARLQVSDLESRTHAWRFGGTQVELGDLNLRLNLGDRYRVNNVCHVYLPGQASFPVATSTAHLKTELVLSGGALEDLDVQVLHLGLNVAPDDGYDGRRFTFQQCVFPGQSTYVSWRPRTEAADRPRPPDSDVSVSPEAPPVGTQPV